MTTPGIDTPLRPMTGVEKAEQIREARSFAEVPDAATAEGSGSVQIGYVHTGVEVQHSFSVSLMALAAWDGANHNRIKEGPMQVRSGVTGLPTARNIIMRHFLDNSPHEWLWMVDTDMGFTGDVVDRLVEAADPVQRPVVGGLCFSLQIEESDLMGGYITRLRPTIFDWVKDPSGQIGFGTRWEYTRDAVTQCAGTGAACLLIHRSAGEKIRAEHGDEWFSPVRYADGTWVGEDLSFCWRLSKMGIPLFVHTGVRTTHAKTVWLSETDYLAQRFLAEASQLAEKAGEGGGS